MRFLKGALTYILAFIACMFVVATALRNWPDGFQMLFAFGAPAIVVWWRSRRRDPAHSRGDDISHATIMQSTGATAGVRAEYVSPPRGGRNVPNVSLPAGVQGWVPKARAVTIAGRTLGGMVYVGTAPGVNGSGYGERCRAYIDPKQPVSSAGADKSGESMPYWPGYSSIPPACRATYLDWLADGAKDSTVNPGYMFLYFYGLERRFLVDNPSDDEKREILAEVQRLREVFGSNHSVQRYLGDFIDLASLVLNDDDSKKPVYKSWTWDLPLPLKVTLGGMIANDIPLSADWLLSWFQCHSEKRLRTAAHRCEDEFRALFCFKFDQRFPKGLKVAKSKKRLKCSYRAASGEFSKDLPISANGRPVLDISGLTKPVMMAQAIADEAMDELDKLSRYLGRNPERKGSFEAHALLPTCLWDQFPSEQRQDLINWVKASIDAGGLVPVGEVFRRLGNESAGKISKRQLTDVADALGSLGFGLAPDPRYGLRMPKEGEPVVLFECDETGDAENASGAYRKALIELALGVFIAQADGRVSESEERLLANRVVQVTDVSDFERRLLKANLDWFLAVPADMSTLRSRLKDVDSDQQTALRAAMIAVAHADGIIQTEEVAGIEKIYRILGLDPSTVYSDLHAGEVSDAPVRVKAAELGAPGEAIPEEISTSQSRLDPSRIAAIRSDTARVSSVLGQIFQSEPDPEPEPEPSTLVSPIAGLDAKCAALVRDVITKGNWGEDEFAELAKRHGLMPLGALEAINEWSFAAYDEALLDEHDGYDVTDDIAQALKTQFEKEVA